MSHLLRRFACTLAGLATLASAASAATYDSSDPYSRQRAPNERGAFEYDDSGDKEWSEDKVKVPPPPAEDAGLAELRLDHLPKGFRAYLDPAAVELNPIDRVLRYWLVVRSGSASTATYEGVNCSTREYKVYAFGDPRSPEGFRPARNPQWQPVGFVRRSDHHWELFDTVLCSGSTPRDASGIAAAVGGYYQRARPLSEYSENLRPLIP